MATSAERAQRRREVAAAGGLCLTCCSRRPEKGRSTCRSCSAKAKERVLRSRARLRDRRRSSAIGRDHEVAGDACVDHHSYRDAATHYERAVALVDPNDAGLLAKLASALFYSERPERARPWLERALEGFLRKDTSAEAAAQALLRLARQSWLESRTHDGLQLIYRARAMLGERSDPAILNRIDFAVAHYQVLLGNYAEASRYLKDADVSDKEPAESLGVLYGQRAIVRATLGEADAAFADFERAIEAAKAIADGYLVTSIWDDDANWATALGKIERARVSRERALLVARERQISWRIPYLTLRYAGLLVVLGEYHRARELVSDALTYDTNTPAIRVLLATVGTDVAHELNDDALLRRALDEQVLELAFQSGEPARIGPISAAFARVYAAGGKPTKAQSLIRRAIRYVMNADHACDLLVLAARYGSRPDSARARDLIAQRARVPNGALARAYLLLWHAYDAERRRRKAEAREQARTAARAFQELGFRHQASQAASIAGMPVAMAPRHSAERSLLGDLRPSLTARESQVAELVLRGMTNRSIAEALSISEHTVEAHMTSIFNRLGLRSRWQLLDLIK